MNSVTLPEKLKHPPSPSEPIDPEVWPLVQALNDAGFHTDYSCGGHGGWPFVAWPNEDEDRSRRLAAFLADRPREAGDAMVWPQLVWRPGGDPFWMLKVVLWRDDAATACARVAGMVRAFAASEDSR